MASNSIAAQFVTLLIEEYKGLPSLWEVDTDAYKNKFTKRKDYETLLHTMLAVDPLLTMNDLKKKIANIRSCYRREVKKISDSIKSGATGDEAYVPTLWYFNQLDFLRDQEPRARAASRSTLFDDDDEEQKATQRQVRAKPRISLHPYKTEFVNVRTFGNETIKFPEPDVMQQNQKNGKHEANTFIIQNRTAEKDEANTFSETWAVLFRKLSHEQQLFGKRCIDEVLYQGQLGNLNADTYRNIETCRRCSTDSESSTTNPSVNCANVKINSSNCSNYDIASKDMSSFFHELCRNPSGT